MELVVEALEDNGGRVGGIVAIVSNVALAIGRDGRDVLAIASSSSSVGVK